VGGNKLDSLKDALAPEGIHGKLGLDVASQPYGMTGGDGIVKLDWTGRAS